MKSFAAITDIAVALNRQRREFDPSALEELRASIQETAAGLQHAVVVRLATPEERSGAFTPHFMLVAGERRLRAIQNIYALGGRFRYAGELVPDGFVPITDLGDLSPLDAFEAELEENIRRRDLSVIERAQATASLMSLRTQQATRNGQPAPVASDIARELYDIPASKPKGEYGSAASTVRDQLIVARHAHDPDVKKATSLREAVKMILRKEESAKHFERAKLAGLCWSKADLQMLHIDAKDWCAAAYPGAFDVILTDPPYGMGADEFGSSGKTGGGGVHNYSDSYETWQELMTWFAPASFRLAAANAHLYAFCDIDRFAEMRDRFAEAGWKVHRTPLIWSNPAGFRVPWQGVGPQRKYELILFAVKGDKKSLVTKSDVLEYARGEGFGHAAQKPIQLLVDLLRRSAQPSDRVFDPFAGSGSTILAAAELKLPAVGLELDDAYFGLALKRLGEIA